MESTPPYGGPQPLDGPVDAFTAWLGAVLHPYFVDFPNFTGADPSTVYSYTVPSAACVRLACARVNLTSDASAGSRVLQLSFQLAGSAHANLRVPTPVVQPASQGPNCYCWALGCGSSSLNPSPGETIIGAPDIWWPPGTAIQIQNDNFQHSGDAYINCEMVFQVMPVPEFSWPNPYLLAHDRDPS